MCSSDLKTSRVDLSFPDDIFLSNICAAKDISVEFISILTSAVNRVLQRSQVIQGVLEKAHSMDSSIGMQTSMSIAAVTAFLNHLLLLPLYAISVGHSIMMCQISGTIYQIGERGSRINIHPAQFSSMDSIAGVCLTVGAEVQSEDTGDSQSVLNIGKSASDLVGIGVDAYRVMEPFMHMVDGCITFFIGLVSKLAMVVSSFDMNRCVLPDVSLNSTVRCACGDTAVSISSIRSNEGLKDFAYWCTGTLVVIGANGERMMVWNPYSYSQLQEIIGDHLDMYVNAASRGHAEPPNHPFFESQGVSVLAILTKCRQN